MKKTFYLNSNHTIRLKSLLSILLFFCCLEKPFAQSITASPGWNLSVASGTITEAGNNYSGSFSSATNQTLVSCTTGFFANYTVSVHKIDTDWNTSLSLWVQRTGTGTGGFLSSISGGTSYIQLTNSPQVLYTGNMFFGTSRNNVPIQYQIQGLSVLLPVKTYTTTVIYTITD